ncbi:MAG: SDR family NAD(P)-dependent oxidoreductase [Bacteroidia bacterium]|nr:SDR family NAD(P)-dependent oxidoreductase [Bacteroidia bacterium]MCF8425124.1 SDR family NAD(P)-dependent oxidoreductase [Bacteroidia bacterium]MCF8446655.1 SDR family NAD(P)-dependent oxidoreductase [Bacteroidia bacterium]
MNKPKQKVLITGGGSGIGLSLARKFLDHGDTVIITGRNLKKLEDAKRELNQIHIYQSDVTKEEDIKKLVDLTQQEFGGIDVLVNNAGIMNLLDSGKDGNDLLKQMEEIEINFHAPIRMLHYFLPQLKKANNATLINVSSGLAYVTFSQAPIYSGTKSALHFWTMAIRPQLKQHQIRVVELLPPVVDTKLADDADLKDDFLKAMPPEKLAAIFWKDYTIGKNEIAPGVSKILRFMSRLAPKFIFKQLNKQAIPTK